MAAATALLCAVFASATLTAASTTTTEAALLVQETTSCESVYLVLPSFLRHRYSAASAAPLGFRFNGFDSIDSILMRNLAGTQSEPRPTQFYHSI